MPDPTRCGAGNRACLVKNQRNVMNNIMSNITLNIMRNVTPNVMPRRRAGM